MQSKLVWRKRVYRNERALIKQNIKPPEKVRLQKYIQGRELCREPKKVCKKLKECVTNIYLMLFLASFYALSLQYLMIFYVQVKSLGTLLSGDCTLV